MSVSDTIIKLVGVGLVIVGFVLALGAVGLFAFPVVVNIWVGLLVALGFILVGVYLVRGNLTF